MAPLNNYLHQGALVGAVLGGAVGFPYAAWGGSSAHNIGKATIHAVWGGFISEAVFDLALPSDKVQFTPSEKLTNLFIEVIAYLGTLLLYRLASPEISLFRRGVICLVSAYMAIMISPIELPENRKEGGDLLAKVGNVRLSVCSLAFVTLFLSTCTCGLACLLYRRPLD